MTHSAGFPRMDFNPLYPVKLKKYPEAYNNMGRTTNL